MKAQTKWFFIGLIGLLILSRVVLALPASPTTLNFISNSTITTSLANRSLDAKGTITVITMDSNQQNYKWKAYVGNVTGKVALDDANGKSIYDWNLGIGSAEVYVSRFSNINWANIACVNQTSIDAEETGLGISLTLKDNINGTFNMTTHKSFDVGIIPMSGCRSTATYINDAPQTMGPAAFFQEVLLRDTTTGNLIYSTLVDSAHTGYDNQPHDFQLIVAENESLAALPSNYFFWVELG